MSQFTVKKPNNNGNEKPPYIPYIKKPTNDENDKQPITYKNGYTRPEKTFTDNLTPEQIEERLEDYEEVKNVEELYKIPLGVHLRYYSTDKQTGIKTFRMGGQLHHNKGLPKYVMLSNGTTQWSVQIDDAIFFRKLASEEIKNIFKEEIVSLKEEIIALKDENKKLKSELKKYKNPEQETTTNKKTTDKTSDKMNVNENNKNTDKKKSNK